jgi:two-component system, chemotaxis family, response regulator Rcp1
MGSAVEIEILLIEDNPADVILTAKHLSGRRITAKLHVAMDGEEALAFLRRQGKHADAARPDLILLDLNLPKKNGCEVLADIKSDRSLKQIPVVVLTTSQDEEDIVRAYDLHANCYLSKPIDLEDFTRMMKSIDDFWFGAVKLPSRRSDGRQTDKRSFD